MVGDVLTSCTNEDNHNNVGWDMPIQVDGGCQYVYEEDKFYHIPLLTNSWWPFIFILSSLGKFLN